MKALLRASLAVLSTAISGCVPQVTTRTPLSDAHRQAIRSSRIVANVGQDALEATYEESNGGAAAGTGFGLLGAVVGAVIDAGVSKHRADTASATVAPVQALLAGFDPSSVAQATLQRELSGVGILQPAKVEVWHEPSLGRTRVATLLDQGEADAVLVVDLRYRLSLKLDHLIVGAIVAIYPTKAASADELRTLASSPSINDLQPCPALYRNAFVTSLPAPPGPGIAGWTMDGGAAARSAIEGGLAEIARMLAWDLEQGGPPGSSYAVPGAKLVERREFGLPLLWYPATTRGSRTWLRAPGGELASTGAPTRAAPSPGRLASRRHRLRLRWSRR